MSKVKVVVRETVVSHKDFDADECEIESTEEQCICPAGYTLSGEGKCVSGSGTEETIPGINNLTQDQVDELLVMLGKYRSGQLTSGSGTYVNPVTRDEYIELERLSVLGMLGLAFEESLHEDEKLDTENIEERLRKLREDP